MHKGSCLCGTVSFEVRGSIPNPRGYGTENPDFNPRLVIDTEDLRPGVKIGL